MAAGDGGVQLVTRERGCHAFLGAQLLLPLRKPGSYPNPHTPISQHETRERESPHTRITRPETRKRLSHTSRRQLLLPLRKPESHPKSHTLISKPETRKREPRHPTPLILLRKLRSYPNPETRSPNPETRTRNQKPKSENLGTQLVK